MRKVKILSSNNPHNLEEQINDFLEQQSENIISVQYGPVATANSLGFTALIEYHI